MADDDMFHFEIIKYLVQLSLIIAGLEVAPVPGRAVTEEEKIKLLVL